MARIFGLLPVSLSAGTTSGIPITDLPSSSLCHLMTGIFEAIAIP